MIADRLKTARIKREESEKAAAVAARNRREAVLRANPILTGRKACPFCSYPVFILGVTAGALVTAWALT